MKPTPDTLIRASAGSGKTFQLTRRYLALLRAGRDPATILATTFTVKAAGEIVRKVFEALAKALLDPAERAELSAQIALPAPAQAALSADDCRRILRRLIAALPALRICTLDSLFVRVLLDRSLRLGLPMTFDVVEAERHAELMDRALEQVLAGRLTDDAEAGRQMALVHAIEQGLARRSPWAALRELAGKPYEFFLDSAPDAWHRLQAPVPPSPAELQRALDDLASFDGETSIANGIRENLARFAEQDWDRFLGTGVAKKIHEGADTYNRRPIPPPVQASMKVLLRHVGHLLVGQIVARNEAIRTLLQDFDARYAELKRRERSYAFGDLPVLLGRAGFNPFQGQGAPIEHVLLDEFQDTSVSQWRALQPVLGGLRGDPERSFFCVGDIKQAIYGWRGGSAELFDRVTAEIPNLTEVSLDVSWRSVPAIVDFVNLVFGDVARNAVLQDWRPAALAWQQAFKRHSTRKEGPGHVCVETAPATDRDGDRRGATLRHAAARVEALHRASPERSIGVLTRTNEAVARLIFELGERGVRASEEGGVPLTDSPAVLVILSALTMADHPSDSASVFNVRHSPLARVLGLGAGDEDLRRSARAIRERLLLQGYGPTIAGWVEALAPHCDARNLVRLQHLERLAFRQTDADPVRPGVFAEFVRTQRVEDPSSCQVRVMTIHKSKGLEFDIVVLPDLDRSLAGQRPPMVAGRPAPADPFDIVCAYAGGSVRRFFPERIRDVFDRHSNGVVSEALCNLYVALTRPRHALHILLAPSRKNERSLRKDYAGLLRAALGATAPLMPGCTIYRSGDPDWSARLGEQERGTTGPAVPESPPPGSAPAGAPSGKGGSGAAGRFRPVEAPASPPIRRGRAKSLSGKTARGDDHPLFAALEVPGPAHARDARPRSPSDCGTTEPPPGDALLRPGRTRFFPRTTPSGQADPALRVPLRSLFDVARNTGAERGTAIHALFQSVGWLDEGLPSAEALARALPPETPGPAGRLLDDFREMLAQPAVRERLSRSHYRNAWSDLCGGAPLELRLHRELPFALWDGERLVSGKIDRLVIGYRLVGEEAVVEPPASREDLQERAFPMGDRAWGVPVAAEVLDYKTDVGEPAELAAHYAPQMAAYRQAAARFTRLAAERISSQLVLLRRGRIAAS